MNKHLNWISFKGKQLLYCDFRNLNTVELAAGLQDALLDIQKMGKNDLLLIFDVSNTFFNRESFSAAVEFAKGIKPFRSKSSLVGVTGGKNFLLNSLLTITNTASVVKSFDSLETAKIWMVI